MKLVIAAVFGAASLSALAAGSAGAQAYGPRPAYAAPGYAAPAYGPGCPVGYHPGGPQGCICDYTVNFYSGYPAGAGYDVHVQMPGARLIGTPVTIPAGAIYVDGPPIYVQAPPVHVASPQVYIRRPQIVVQPSEVNVEPPTVHTEPCPDGSTCEGVGQSLPGGAAHYSAPRHSYVSPSHDAPAPRYGERD